MKLVIFFVLFLIVNIIAQSNISFTYDIKGYKDLKLFIEENGLDKNVLKKRHIEKKDDQILFYNDNGDIIKTVNFKPDYTYIQISKNNKYFVLTEKNTIQYPSHFICIYYNHKGEILHKGEYSTPIGPTLNGFLYRYKRGGGEIPEEFFIYSKTGQLLNHIFSHGWLFDIDYDFSEKILFNRRDSRYTNPFLTTVDKNGQIMWEYPIYSKTVESMITVNKKNKKVIIGKGDKLIILNYDGTEDYIIPVKYDYGSYLSLSNDDKLLAVFNDEINTPNNRFYIIDFYSKEILVEKKLDEIGERKLVRYIVFSNDNKYILIENTVLPWSMDYLIYDIHCNLLFRYKKRISEEVEFFVKSNTAYIIGKKSIKVIKFPRR